MTFHHNYNTGRVGLKLKYKCFCAGLTQPQRTFRRNYTTHALYFCKASLTARGQSRFMSTTTVVISIVFFHFSSQL